ncbi:MAG: transposase [Deltaproteobacteria bacterium]|nr:transposase [Deltaproteobacteria bacterium]
MASPDDSSSNPDAKPSPKDATQNWNGKQKILPSVVAEIRRLHLVEHWRINTIAAALGIHRDTVSRALGSFLPRQEEKLDAKSTADLRPPKAHALDEFYEFIERTLREHPSLTTTRLTDILKERGFEKTHYVVRRYIKKHNLRPQPRKTAFLRLNPMKGEQAQVDWAQVGELNVAGGKRKLWLFIMTLSWSRASWGELVFDLTADSLQRSLARAAEYFGGNTRQWLFECASLPLGQSAHHRHCSAW